MKKVSNMVKETKLFDTKVFNLLSPKEQDCITDIFEKVDANKDNDAFFLTTFNQAIEVSCNKHNVDKFKVENFLDNNVNEILGVKI